MEFLMEHIEIISGIAGILFGILMSKKKINLFGQKIGKKFPEKVVLNFADHLDAFEKGLRQQDVNGDTSIITNEQLSKATEKLKIDMGFDQKLKEKALK